MVYPDLQSIKEGGLVSKLLRDKELGLETAKRLAWYVPVCTYWVIIDDEEVPPKGRRINLFDVEEVPDCEFVLDGTNFAVGFVDSGDAVDMYIVDKR